MRERTESLGVAVLAAVAFAAIAPCAASADTYAKPVIDSGTGGYVLKFFTDEACTAENAAQTAIDGETTVFFANDAEFQALAAPGVKEQVANAKGGAPYLQNDVSLEADCDWRAFDFNINGKTIDLAGCKLSAGRIAGEGTITCEYVVNGDFEANNGWNKNPTGWTRNTSGRCAILNGRPQVYAAGGSYWAVLYAKDSDLTGQPWFAQEVNLPKNARYLLTFKYQTSGYNQSGKYHAYSGATLKVTLAGNPWTIDDIGTSVKTWSKEVDLNAGAQELKFLKPDTTTGLCFDKVSLSLESTLELDISAGADYDAGGLTLTGAGLQVVKSGEGNIVFSKGNPLWGYANKTTLTVEGGGAKQGVKNACGAQYADITVNDGAQFDINGKLDWDKDYTVSGGTLTSTAALAAGDAYTGKSSGNGFLRNIVLSGDATVRSSSDGNMGVWFYQYEANTATMGGRTLTYDGAAHRAVRIFLGNMSYSGEGKIVVAPDCWVQTHVSSPSAPDCDVEVFGGYWQNTGVLSPVKSLVFREGSSFRELNASPSAIIVYERYAPPQTSESATGFNKRPLVQLGAAGHTEVTLDLSEFPGAFDDRGDNPTVTYYNTGNEYSPLRVKIDVSEKNCTRSKAIYLYGRNRPENVVFVRGEKMEAAKILLRERNHGDDLDGIYAGPGSMFIIR